MLSALVASVCEGILNLDLTSLCFLVLKNHGFLKEFRFGAIFRFIGKIVVT